MADSTRSASDQNAPRREPERHRHFSGTDGERLAASRPRLGGHPVPQRAKRDAVITAPFLHRAEVPEARVSMPPGRPQRQSPALTPRVGSVSGRCKVR